MGYCQGCCHSTYKSIVVGSSQKERSEGQANDLGCHKASLDPLCIQKEDMEEDI
jgi:TPP-dependent indolepyruvate ferredoxin oxidoreductase alpha subunit